MAAAFTEYEIKTMFSILGIDPVKDENAIRDAYRQRLTQTNPEDDPQGFMRLRGAYERALTYAKTKDEEPEKPRLYDDTPAGQWIAKADKLYRDFAARKDPENWIDLFHEEAFQSLDGEQECIDRMLVFFTRHFYFPTEVWKVFDRYLNITGNTAAVKEKIPAPFVNMLVNKCRNGESICFDYFEGPADGEYDMFLSLLVQCEGSLYTGHPEEARRLMGELEKLNVTHPAKKLVMANLLLADKKPEEALDLLKGLTVAYPSDKTYRNNYARVCWDNGRREEAAEIYQKILEENPGDYAANRALTAWYFDKGDVKTAKKHAEKVLKTGGDDAFAELLHRINDALIPVYREEYAFSGNVADALDLGWCYLQNRHLISGLRFIEGFEGQVPPDSRAMYYSLLAKMHFENVHYDEALKYTALWREELQKKMKADREKPERDREEEAEDERRLRQTYLLNALAWEYKGHADSRYYRNALEEVEHYEDQFGEADDILYEKAEIYYSMGEYEKGIKTAEHLTDERQFFLGLTVKLKCCSRLGDAAGVVQVSRPLWHFYPKYARGYEEIARLFRELKRRDELQEVLNQAEKNGVKSAYLDAAWYGVEHDIPSEALLNIRWREFLNDYFTPFEKSHDMKLYDEGIRLVSRLFNQFPANAVLNMRALMYMEADHLEEAEKDLTKILEIDPYDERALNNMGLLYKFREKYDEAVICLRKAILYADPAAGVPANAFRNLCGVYERMGEYALAAEANDALRSRTLSAMRNVSTNEMRIRLLTEDRKSLRATARYLGRDGKWEDALRLLEGYGRNSDLVLDRIGACVNAGKFAQADEELKSAVPRIIESAYDDSVLKTLLEIRGMKAAKEYLARLSGHVSGDLERLEILEKELFLLLAERDSGEKALSEEEKACLAEKAEKALAVKASLQENFPGQVIFSGRYLAWVDFLDAAAREDTAGMEKALKQMEEHRRCRNCRETVCIRLAVAKAMLLEKNGETEEAQRQYAGLAEKLPFDIYAPLRRKDREQ